MISATRIRESISQGIGRFQKTYNENAGNIQIVFSLDAATKKVLYMICVKRELKNSVSLKQLIGSNIYNGLVEQKIKNLLVKFEADKNSGVNLLCGIDNNSRVYIELRDKHNTIREITDHEFL